MIISSKPSRFFFTAYYYLILDLECKPPGFKEVYPSGAGVGAAAGAGISAGIGRAASGGGTAGRAAFFRSGGIMFLDSGIHQCTVHFFDLQTSGDQVAICVFPDLGRRHAGFCTRKGGAAEDQACQHLEDGEEAPGERGTGHAAGFEHVVGEVQPAVSGGVVFLAEDQVVDTALQAVCIDLGKFVAVLCRMPRLLCRRNKTGT